MILRSAIAIAVASGVMLFATVNAQADDRVAPKANAYGAQTTPLVYYGGSDFSVEEARRPYYRYRAYRPYYRPYYRSYGYGYGSYYRPYNYGYRYSSRPYYWY